MSSAMKLYVHIQGVFDDYVSIKAVDVGGTIEDFIELILKEKQSKLSAHFNVNIDAGEVQLYYQGSGRASKSKPGSLVKHDDSFEDIVGVVTENLYFRMEIKQVRPVVGKFLFYISQNMMKILFFENTHCFNSSKV